MKLADAIPRSAVVVPLRSVTVEGALDELAEAMTRAHGLNPVSARTALHRREALGSTALGNGIALPHGRDELARTVGAFGVSPAGIEWGAPDGKRVHLVVALLSPLGGSEHLVALASVGRRLGDAAVHGQLVAARDTATAHALLVGADARES